MLGNIFSPKKNTILSNDVVALGNEDKRSKEGRVSKASSGKSSS